MQQVSVIAGRLLLVLTLLVSGVPCISQKISVNQPVMVAPNLLRLEGVDADSGIHYVRLLFSLPPIAGSTKSPGRFTMECTENKGKRDLVWFVSFGGIDDIQFTPPFRPTQTELFPPDRPSISLKMTFEGYMKWKPYTRVWEVLPSGELRYRNPGMQGPNMETPRYFLPYLNSLPGLRIVLAKYAPGNPPELFFQTQPLLDEMKKIPLCAP